MPGQNRSVLEDALSSPPLSNSWLIALVFLGTYCNVCIGLELGPLRVSTGDEV
jgi:hypothetical protein